MYEQKKKKIEKGKKAKVAKGLIAKKRCAKEKYLQ